MSQTRLNSAGTDSYELSLKLSVPQDVEGIRDDDISIASRTSSPLSGCSTDVYDSHKHERSPPFEEITVETKIKPTNKGFAMLARLGWTEGQPLGLSADGRIDPVPFQVKRDVTGLGKTNQDFRMIETTVSHRRGMVSEHQQKETEDQRRAREDMVARRAALENEISTTLKAFYCVLCDKQFKNVAQYDEHTNSYAHHHKARFRDMQANVRLKPKDEVDKRKEKERKREEKELRKIAAANGIKMARTSASVTSDSPAVPPQAAGDAVPHKRNGWTIVSSHTSTSVPSNLGSATIMSASSSVSSTSESTGATRGTDPSSMRPSAAPVFRAGGWTSLDEGTKQQAFSSLPTNSEQFDVPTLSPRPPRSESPSAGAGARKVGGLGHFHPTGNSFRKQRNIGSKARASRMTLNVD